MRSQPVPAAFCLGRSCSLTSRPMDRPWAASRWFCAPMWCPRPQRTSALCAPVRVCARACAGVALVTVVSFGAVSRLWWHGEQRACNVTCVDSSRSAQQPSASTTNPQPLTPSLRVPGTRRREGRGQVRQAPALQGLHLPPRDQRLHVPGRRLHRGKRCAAALVEGGRGRAGGRAGVAKQPA